MIRLDARARTMLAALLPAALLAMVLAGIFSQHQIDSLEGALAARGRAAAGQLADAVNLGFLLNNRPLLARAVSNVIQRDAEIMAATIFDPHGITLARGGSPTLSHLPEPIGAPTSFVAGGVLVVVMPIRADPAETDASPRGGESARARAALSGVVVLELSRARLRQEQGRLLALGAAVTAFGLLLGGLLAAYIARGVTRPVQRMTDVVRRIAGGELSARVHPDPSASVRELEDGINEMAQRISLSHEFLQSRIAEATAELRSRKDEAESATAAKSRFIAAASHDLRQPMHALGLFVSRMGTLQLSHEAHGVARHIEAAVSALADLLDALLDVSRIDAGLVVPKVGAVAVEHLFDRVEFQLGEAARRQGLTFRRFAPPGLHLRTDPVLVERILVNLAGNALRYTEQGGILLASRRRGDRVRLEVWDTGIGIPAESQQAIFEEYMQLGNPERDRAKGLGLGLSICQRLAHLLDTRLQLRSVPGRGSVFWFDIPLGEEHTNELRGQPRQLGDDIRGKMTNNLAGTVAIVDDDELVLASTVDLATSWGCRVIAGVSLADVLAECEASASRPDAAIFDYRLRGLENGLDSARALQHRYGDVPVMILTGNLTEPLKREAAQYGFTLMAKPLKPARLRALLQHMLEQPSVP